MQRTETIEAKAMKNGLRRCPVGCNRHHILRGFDESNLISTKPIEDVEVHAPLSMRNISRLEMTHLKDQP
jgi:hypothetical protein